MDQGGGTQLAQDQFADVFARPAQVHGAAGWQLNSYVPALEQELGFRYASDVRGTEPFMPVIDGLEIPVPQLPTTLPTLDELIGLDTLQGVDPVDYLLAQTDASAARQHVFTLHAELEGGAYLNSFERLLGGWRARDFSIGDLSTSFATSDIARLPRSEILFGQFPGVRAFWVCRHERISLSRAFDTPAQSRRDRHSYLAFRNS